MSRTTATIDVAGRAATADYRAILIRLAQGETVSDTELRNASLDADRGGRQQVNADLAQARRGHDAHQLYVGAGWDELVSNAEAAAAQTLARLLAADEAQQAAGNEMQAAGEAHRVAKATLGGATAARADAQARLAEALSAIGATGADWQTFKID